MPLTVGAVCRLADEWMMESGLPPSLVSGPEPNPNVALWRVIHRVYLRAERSGNTTADAQLLELPHWGVWVKAERTKGSPAPGLPRRIKRRSGRSARRTR